MSPTANFQTSLHSHNDNSYVDNSTNFTQVDNRTVSADVRGFEILPRQAAVGASYNSSERESAAVCLRGTRQDVLDCICKWADSRGKSTVCLLYGPGGLGKSTLATTLAAMYDQENRLAGSFFFSRDPRHNTGRQSINKVVPTIAYQNSISCPLVGKKIIQALDSDPTILSKSLETQFHSLLVGPFRRSRIRSIASKAFISLLLKVWAAVYFAQTFREVWIAFISCIIFHPLLTTDCREMIRFVFVALVAASAAATHPTLRTALQTHIEAFLYPPPMIVIIDAIDECHGSVEILIKMIADKYCDLLVPIRFFITSRPEEEILGEFNRYPERVYSLDLMAFPAHGDIRLFLEEELKVMKTKHLVYGGPGDLEGWPSPHDLDLLVKRSEGLFIYAASLLNFIGDCNRGGDPKSRLRLAMYRNEGLDTLFGQVLRDAPEFRNPDFHRVLGAICFLYEEFSLGSLAVLLRLDGAADVRRILRGCRSILHIPQSDDESITFVHTSLHGFLTNRSRSQNYAFDRIDYWIDLQKQHLSLLYDCIQLIVAESQNRSIKEPHQLNYFGRSASYAWENWPRHLFDLQLTYQGIIDLSRAHFGGRYDGLLLYFLDRLSDGTLNLPVTWAVGHRAIIWPGLELTLSRLEDKDTELSDRMRRIRKTLETLRFHAMFPGAHKFDFKGCDFNEAWDQHVDHSPKDVCNIAVAIEAEAQTELNELNHLLDLETWKKVVSISNMLVAKNGVYVRSESLSEDFEDSHSPEPEHQPETQQIQKHLIIYTSSDVEAKTLKQPIDIVFTLTPPTAESDRPWPAIVWKTLHCEKTTATKNDLFWSSQSGFCVVEELDDATLKPSDLCAVVKPGYAAILQNMNSNHDMSEQLPIPFKTNAVAVSNLTGSRLRLALCSIDPTKESDNFAPVVDLDAAASFGKHVFACRPPTMLQAYAVSGYRDRQPIDPSQLLCPLFLDASSSAPQAINLSKLEKPLTAFQLYSHDSGKIVLEMTDDVF